MTKGWNFADTWEAVATLQPTSPAQIHGERAFTWDQFNQRSDRLARTLIDAALPAQAKVAIQLFNCPEYLETVFACFKARLVPVNTNYRYKADELVYLWDNADVEAVVFDAAFADTVAAVRERLPRLVSWICVDATAARLPTWARAYESIVSTSSPRVTGVRRSGDDAVLFYTGGTTGLPKGVVWRQDDLFRAETSDLGLPEVHPGHGDLPRLIKRHLHAAGSLTLAASPLMHGAAFYTALGSLSFGGAIVSLLSRQYDPLEVLDAIVQRRIDKLVIVGDVFARPLLRALDREPRRWDLSSLTTIVSSGAIWSRATKQALLRHSPTLTLWDSLSATEAFGLGSSVVTGGNVLPSGRFAPGANVALLDPQNRRIVLEPGAVGVLAVGGATPLAYYKDEERTRATFINIDGGRHVVSGDWARVEADGTFTLLGRGSACINTGGEKVFPGEVELVIRSLPAVADCVVLGVPDIDWGETVTAIVSCANGEFIDAATVMREVKLRLAGYKAPRHVIFADIERGENGKVDDQTMRRLAQVAIARRS